MSGAFPSRTRSILTEIYLCHACSCHEIEDRNVWTGLRDLRGQELPRMLPVRVQDERWEERFVVGRQHPGGGDETLMRP